MSNLELRDAGKWVCEIGSSTKENFQVQTKEFLIEIESKSFHPYDLTSASIRDIKPTSEFTTPSWSHSSPSEAVGAHVADAERQHGRHLGVSCQQTLRRLPLDNAIRSNIQLQTSGITTKTTYIQPPQYSVHLMAKR